MTNPSDISNATFSVLTNAEGQHSLWPGFADVPTGWSVAYGPALRGKCIEFMTANWGDRRAGGYGD